MKKLFVLLFIVILFSCGKTVEEKRICWDCITKYTYPHRPDQSDSLRTCDVLEAVKLDEKTGIAREGEWKGYYYTIKCHEAK